MIIVVIKLSWDAVMMALLKPRMEVVKLNHKDVNQNLMGAVLMVRKN